MMKKLLIGICLLALSVPAWAQVGAPAERPLVFQNVGSITAAQGVVTLNANGVDGTGMVGIGVTGVFVGTIIGECGLVDSATYDPLTLTVLGLTTTAVNITAPGRWTMSTAGCRWVRARATAWTSGTATVTLVGVTGGYDGTTIDATIASTLGTTATDINSLLAAVNSANANDLLHDDPDGATKPIKIGARAESSLSGSTLVADGDRTNLYGDLDGVLVVRPWTILEDILQDIATNTNGTSTAFTGGLAAPGSGIRIWLSTCTIANSSATAVTLDIRDGSAGSVLWTFPVPANTAGVTHTWALPLRFTANTAVAYDGSAAATTITISCNGFKSKI